MADFPHGPPRPVVRTFMGLHPTRHYYEDSNPEKLKMPSTLMARPAKFNSSGKPASIHINSHRILERPTKTVYQYDASFTIHTPRKFMY